MYEKDSSQDLERAGFAPNWVNTLIESKYIEGMVVRGFKWKEYAEPLGKALIIGWSLLLVSTKCCNLTSD
jgi:hypothetical protein